MTMELHATPQEVMRAVETVREFARGCGFGEKDIFALALALEECGSNIVNHALRGDASQTFRVQARYSKDAITIELRDRGPEYDPTAQPDRKLEAEEDDPPGGWGVQLVRRYMDEIRYQRDGGENVLSLTRKLASANGNP